MDVEIEQRGILKRVQAHGSSTNRNQFAKIKKTWGWKEDLVGRLWKELEVQWGG